MSPRSATFTAALVSIIVFSRPAWSGFFVPTAGPIGRNALDVAAAPDGDLFATTSDQSVSRLQSGASRWTNLPALPAPVSAVEVAPDGQIWVFGAGDQFVSSDHGQTWDRPAVLPAILQVAFDAAGRVFAATGAGLYRSADRGKTWTLLALPQATIEAVDATTNGEVWAAVAGGLYRSSDAGSTWTQVTALPLPATAVAAHPAGGAYVGLASNGYPTCQPGGLYRANTNGALTLLGFAGQPVSDILVRNDGSATISVDSGCRYYEACSGCAPGTTCAGQGVYRSTDGGVTWSEAQLSTASVPRELAVRNDGTLFTTTGTYACDICWTLPPGILSSADGGATWSALPIGPGNGTGAATWVDARPGPQTIFAASNTSVYMSTDHGLDWLLLADVSPTLCAQITGANAFATHPFGVVFAFDGDVVYAVSLGSVLSGPGPVGGYDALRAAAVVTATGSLLAAAVDGVHSASGAVAGIFNWSPGFGPTDLRFLEAGPSRRVAGSGYTGTYVSDDGGIVWTRITTVGDGPLAFAPDGHTLYVADGSGAPGSRVYRLVDAGGSWIQEPVTGLGFPPSVYWIQDLLLDPTGALYALAPDGPVLRLKADRWEDLGTIPYARSLAMAADGYLYIGTWQGVWRSSAPLGQLTATEPFTEGVTSVRVFPNPFGARTAITFALLRADRVQLAVYDVRGRLVSALLRGSNLDAGPQAATWVPPAALPNGVYIYRLRTSLGERSGRLSLIR